VKASRLLLPLVVALAVFAVLQVLIMQEVLNAYWEKIISLSFIVTICCMGLSIIYGFTGQFSLGHAAFYGIGAYAAAMFTTSLQVESPFGFLAALIIGGAAAGGVAFLIGLPILRLRSDYLGIATLGFGVMARTAFDNSDSLSPLFGGARGMTGIPALASFPWAFALIIIAIIVVRNFIYSSPGRACLAIREDEIAADIMGINTTRYKTIAFVIGCAYAGVAGGLYAHFYRFVHPSNFDFLKSVDFLMVVVLGGLGSMSGTIIASIGWTFLLEGLRFVLPSNMLDFRMVIYPLILIAMMLLRPRGIFGGSELGPLKPPRDDPQPQTAEARSPGVST
jgi:branched-chain amino acid transport system permease protein